MVSHPSDKNKDVARVGHPQFVVDRAKNYCGSFDFAQDDSSLDGEGFGSGQHLEVALPLFDLHGAFLVVVDDAVGALGGAELQELRDDVGEGGGVGSDGAGAGGAA